MSSQDKSPDAFRTISEVAEDLDLPQHVLRFWETRFSQIKPLKRGGGRRYYRPDDVELLKGIRYLLYGEGYTIKGVQRILKEQGPRFVMQVRHEAAHPVPTLSPETPTASDPIDDQERPAVQAVQREPLPSGVLADDAPDPAEQARRQLQHSRASSRRKAGSGRNRDQCGRDQGRHSPPAVHLVRTSGMQAHA